MKVIPLRVYKHWGDHRLLSEIEVSIQESKDGHKDLTHLNLLFQEAKLRGLTLGREELWRKILHLKEK